MVHVTTTATSEQNAGTRPSPSLVMETWKDFELVASMDDDTSVSMSVIGKQKKHH